MDTPLPTDTTATASMSHGGNHTVASNDGTVSYKRHLYEKTPVATFTIQSHIDSMGMTMTTDRHRSKTTRERAATSWLKPFIRWHRYGAERRLTVLV